MNLQRDNYNLRNYKYLIRCISIFLIIAFLWQNISWANPDIQSYSAVSRKPHNLLVETNFANAEHSHRLTAKVIQAIIENAANSPEELDLPAIKRTLEEYDAWGKKTRGNYKWTYSKDDTGLITDIEITCRNNRNKVVAVMRYFEVSDDPDLFDVLPKAWEGIKVQKLNANLCLQVKRPSSKKKPKRSKKTSRSTSSGEYGHILKAETIYKDYYRLILRNILEVFVLMAERRKKLEEDQGKRKGKKEPLFAEGDKQGAMLLLDNLRRRVSSFEERLKELGDEYSLSYEGKPLGERFEDVKRLLKRPNEPAACASLVSVLEIIADAKKDVQDKKLSFWRRMARYSSKRKRVKVWRTEEGMIAVEINPHVRADERSKTLVKDRGVSLHKTRWSAGRFLDHQEDGCLDDRDKMKGAAEKLDAASKLEGHAAVIKAYDALESITKEVEDPIDEEKKLIGDVTSAIGRMVDIGYTKYVPQLIPIARRHIEMKARDLKDMAWHIANGRVRDLRRLVEEENNSFLGYEGELLRFLKKGEYGTAYGKTKNGLIPKITPHFSEPELWEMEAILEAVKYRFLSLYRLAKSQKDEKGRTDTHKRHLDKANLWMEIAGRKFAMTKLLGTFMERFRKEYVERRLKKRHEESEYEALKIDTFKDVFIDFIRLKKMDTDSPKTRAFQLLCYLAVFVPLEKRNPLKKTEKVPNPVFDYMNKLRIFIEIDDVKAIRDAKWVAELKQTHARFKGIKYRKKLKDLSPASKEKIVEALKDDLRLTQEEREEVDKIFTLNKSIMRMYMRPKKEKKKPLGMMRLPLEVLNFVTGNRVSNKFYARFCAFWEEPIIALLFVKVLPWIAAFLGLPEVSGVWFYLAANLIYGFSHPVLHRWEKDKPLGFSPFGLENVSKGRVISGDRATPVRYVPNGITYYTEGKEVVGSREEPLDVATPLNKLAFSAFGMFLRLFYFIPGVNFWYALGASIFVHALYNNWIAYKTGWVLGMARRPFQRKFDLFDAADEAQRERMLVRCGLYNEASLRDAKDLYMHYRINRHLADFSVSERVAIWKYVILSRRYALEDDLFQEIDAEIERLDEVHNEEIDGAYIGYKWSGRRGLSLDDKVNSIMDNVDIERGERVLDVGCGNGKVIISLARVHPGASFVGVDASPYNLSSAVDTLMAMGRGAPRNVFFHLRDCRINDTGIASQVKGIPYLGGIFDKVFLLEGMMDLEGFPESWYEPIWREIVRLVKKDDGRVVFYGLKGESAFYKCLPEGISVEKERAYFNLNGYKRKEFFPGWGRVNDYKWNGTELYVWRVHEEEPVPEPEPQLQQVEKEEPEEEGDEQLGLFPGEEGPPLGQISWLMKPFVKLGLSDEDSAARFSFVVEEPLFMLLFRSILPWFVAVIGFPDVSPWLIYIAANVIYGFSHNIISRWRPARLISIPHYGLRHERAEKEITDEDDYGEKERADTSYRIGFSVLGILMRLGYFLPFLEPAQALLLSMVVHAFYNNYLSRIFNLPVGKVSFRSMKPKFSWVTLRNVFFGTIIAAISATVAVSAWSGVPIYGVAVPVVMVPTVFLLARKIEKRRLDYYTDKSNLADILRSPGGTIGTDEARKKEIEKLFRRVLRLYKSYFIRDLEEKRKKLLVEVFLVNVKPAEEKIDIGSDVRSDIVVELFFSEVLSSNDRSIYEPALEAIIEVLAQEKRDHKTFFFKRFFPLLERSGKLPRFARMLIDELIKAEHRKIRLFYIENENEFFDETKEIIRMLAQKAPDLKTEIMAYLFELAETTKEEIPLVRALLDYMRFHIVPSEDFGKFAAGKIAVEIKRLQDELDRPVNIVLSGGRTMAEFFDELAEMPGIDWSRVNIFQVAEYKGLSLEDEFSLAHYMDERLLRKISIPRSNIHFIGRDPDKKAYMEELKVCGGADMFILGIGANGQVAFNEPHSNLANVDELNEVELSPETIEAKKVFYPDAEKAYTMSLADIIASGAHVFLFAAGEAKADIVKKAFFGEVDFTNVPVSVFQQYPNATIIFDKGAMQLVASNLLDQYLKAVKAQHRSEARYNELFDLVPVGLMRLDRDGVIVMCNDKLADMFGHTKEEMLWKPIFEFIPPDERGDATKKYQRKMSRHMDLKGFERKYLHEEGRVIWGRVEDHQILNSAGEVTGMLTSVQDITELKELQGRLEEQALRDPLTNVLNQRYLEKVFPRVYERYVKDGAAVSLLIVDINDLKKINNSYGIAAGHEVMRQVAQFLGLSLERSGDILAREFGDEFLIILPDTTAEGAKKVAEKILEGTETLRIRINGGDIKVGLAIGIAERQEEEPFDSLVIRAAKALKRARKNKIKKAAVDRSPPVKFRNNNSLGNKLPSIIGIIGLGVLAAEVIYRYFTGDSAGAGGSAAIALAAATFLGSMSESGDEIEQRTIREINSLKNKIADLTGALEKAEVNIKDIEKVLRKIYKLCKKVRTLTRKRQDIAAFDEELYQRLHDGSIILNDLKGQAEVFYDKAREKAADKEDEDKKALEYTEKPEDPDEYDDGEVIAGDIFSEELTDLDDEYSIDIDNPEAFVELIEKEASKVQDDIEEGLELEAIIYSLSKLDTVLQENMEINRPWLVDSYPDLYVRLIEARERLKDIAKNLEDEIEDVRSERKGANPARMIEYKEKELEKLKAKLLFGRDIEETLDKVRLERKRVADTRDFLETAYPEVYEEQKARYRDVEKELETLEARTVTTIERRHKGLLEALRATPERHERFKMVVDYCDFSVEYLTRITAIDPILIVRYIEGEEPPPRALVKMLASSAGIEPGRIWLQRDFMEMLLEAPKISDRCALVREYLVMNRSTLSEELKKRGYLFHADIIAEYETYEHEGDENEKMNPIYFKVLAEFVGIDPGLIIFGKTLSEELKRDELEDSEKFEKTRRWLGLSRERAAEILQVSVELVTDYARGVYKYIPGFIMDEMAKLARINRKDLRKGGPTIEAILMISVAGLLATMFAIAFPVVKAKTGIETLHIILVCAGFIAGVITVSILRGIHKFFERGKKTEKKESYTTAVPQDDESLKELKKIIVKKTVKKKVKAVDSDISLYRKVIKHSGYSPKDLDSLLKKASVYADVAGGIGIACVEAAEAHTKLKVCNVDMEDWKEEDVEISPEKWEKLLKAKEKLKEEGRYVFKRGDIQTVELPERSDLITSFFTLRFVKDPIKAFINLYNQLKAGGTMLVTVTIPNDSDMEKSFQHIVERLRDEGYADVEMKENERVFSNDIKMYVIRLDKLKEDNFVSDLVYVASKEVTVGVNDKTVAVFSSKYKSAEEVREDSKDHVLLKALPVLEELVGGNYSLVNDLEKGDMEYDVSIFFEGKSGDKVLPRIENLLSQVGIVEGDQFEEKLSDLILHLSTMIEQAKLLRPEVLMIRRVEDEKRVGIELVIRGFTKSLSEYKLYTDAGFTDVIVESGEIKFGDEKSPLVEEVTKAESPIEEGVRVIARYFPEKPASIKETTQAPDNKAPSQDEKTGEDQTQSGAPGITHKEFNEKLEKMLQAGKGKTVFTLNCETSPNNQDLRKDEAYNAFREMVQNDLPTFNFVPLVKIGEQTYSHKVPFYLKRIMQGESPVEGLKTPKKIEIVLVKRLKNQKTPLYWKKAGRGKGAIIQVAHAGRGLDGDDQRMVIYMDEHFVNDHLDNLRILKKLVAEEMAEEIARRNGFYARDVHDHLVGSGQVKDLYEEYKKYYRSILGPNPKFLHGRAKRYNLPENQNVASGSLGEESVNEGKEGAAPREDPLIRLEELLSLQTVSQIREEMASAGYVVFVESSIGGKKEGSASVRKTVRSFVSLMEGFSEEEAVKIAGFAGRMYESIERADPTLPAVFMFREIEVSTAKGVELVIREAGRGIDNLELCRKAPFDQYVIDTEEATVTSTAGKILEKKPGRVRYGTRVIARKFISGTFAGTKASREEIAAFLKNLDRGGVRTVPIYHPEGGKAMDMDVEIFKMLASSFIGLMPIREPDGTIRWYDMPASGGKATVTNIYTSRYGTDFRVKVPDIIAESYKGKRLVVRPHPDGRLSVWTMADISRIRKNNKIRMSDEKAMQAATYLGNSCITAQIDKYGRIRLPEAFCGKMNGIWGEKPTHFKIYEGVNHFDLFPVHDEAEREKEAYSQLLTKEDVINNARKTARLAKRSLEALASRTEEEEEEAVLILDLPQGECENVQSLIDKNVIKPLKWLGLKDPKIAARSRKLRIVSSERIDLVRDKIKRGELKADNVIIMTTNSRVETDAFNGFEASYITALDSSALKVLDKTELEAYYYPYFEATFFSILRAFGAYDYASSVEEDREKYRQRLWKWYTQIPNIEKLSREDFINRCFQDGHPKRLLILNLALPRMEKFDPREVYSKIREFILTQA